MATIVCKGFRDFERKFKSDMLKRAKLLQKAVHKTAEQGLDYANEHTIPVAFGELRDSGHVSTTGAVTKIIWDAPHAAAVENGSRPHTPPLAPLLKWVKLRGLTQGNLARVGRQRRWTRKGVARVRRLPGTTTAHHALNLSAQIAIMESKGVVPVDMALQIARAIQMAIKAHGTKPHHFALKALPFIRSRLHANLQAALKMGL